MLTLHSGAGLHKHEYSPEDAPTRPTLPQTSSWIRSPLSTAIAAFPAFYGSETQQSNGDRSDEKMASSTTKYSSSASSPTLIADTSVLGSDESIDTMSDDCISEVGTLPVKSAKSRKRRGTRPRTTYHLAHPAPTHLTQKKLLHIRPKLILQMQRLSPNARPEPTLDVIPVHHFSLPRLAKKLPRCKKFGECGFNDVMVVSSEDYRSAHDESHLLKEDSEEEHSNDKREVIAAIYQMKKEEGSQGMVEIFLADGSVWKATPKANGNYEFVLETEGDARLTARWVRRPIPRDDKESDPHAPTYKHTFSIVDPKSRRHPIMATLTHGTMEIPDTFTTVPGSRDAPPSPRAPGRSDADSFASSTASERKTHAIDSRLRMLIQVTGVWVALREGVSPYFRYTTSSSQGTSSARAAATPPELNRLNSDTPTIDSTSSSQSRRSGLFHRTPVSPASPTFDKRATLPKRSTSISAAVMSSVGRRSVSALNESYRESSPTGQTQPRRSMTLGAYDKRFSLPSRASSPSNGERSRPVSYGPYRAASPSLGQDILPGVDEVNSPRELVTPEPPEEDLATPEERPQSQALSQTHSHLQEFRFEQKLDEKKKKSTKEGREKKSAEKSEKKRREGKFRIFGCFSTKRRPASP